MADSNTISIKGTENYVMSTDVTGDFTAIDISEIPGYTVGSKLRIQALKLTTNGTAGVEVNLKQQDDSNEYRQFFNINSPVVMDFGSGWYLDPDKDFVINKDTAFPMLGTVVAELIPA